MDTMKKMLAGAIMMSAWAIFVFFLRFWRRTRDRLFAFFAAAFLLLGVERVAMAASASEFHPFCYLIRLCAFLLIVIAILEKNRSGAKG